jgi:hypothetical protein
MSQHCDLIVIGSGPARPEVASMLAEQERLRDRMLEATRLPAIELGATCLPTIELEATRLPAIELERHNLMPDQARRAAEGIEHARRATEGIEQARRAAEAFPSPRDTLMESTRAAQVLQDRIADLARAALVPPELGGIPTLQDSIRNAMVGGLAERAFVDSELFRRVADDFIQQRDLISRFIGATTLPDFEDVSSEVVAEHLTDTLTDTLAADQLDGSATTVSFEQLALGWFGRVRPEWRTYDVLTLLLALLSLIYAVISGAQQAASSNNLLIEQRRARELADSSLAEQKRANALG